MHEGPDTIFLKCDSGVLKYKVFRNFELAVNRKTR